MKTQIKWGINQNYAQNGAYFKMSLQMTAHCGIHHAPRSGVSGFCSRVRVKWSAMDGWIDAESVYLRSNPHLRPRASVSDRLRSGWDRVRSCCFLMSKGASWGGLSTWSRPSWASSGYVQLVGDPGVAPEHAGEIIYLIWLGNALESPRRSWKTLLGTWPQIRGRIWMDGHRWGVPQGGKVTCWCTGSTRWTPLVSLNESMLVLAKYHPKV